MATIPTDKTAVLIMDYQNDIVANHTANDPGLTKRGAKVLDGARQAHIPVIHVVIRFRDGYPEVGNRGAFKGIKEGGRLKEGSHGAEIHPDVAPKPGDIIVTRRRTGAFAGSDLEVVLRSQSRDTLVLMGIATSGVVLTTLRWAADLDYSLVVIADCCGDRDPELHRVLTEKVYPRQAAVMTSTEFLAALPKK